MKLRCSNDGLSTYRMTVVSFKTCHVESRLVHWHPRLDFEIGVRRGPIAPEQMTPYFVVTCRFFDPFWHLSCWVMFESCEIVCGKKLILPIEAAQQSCGSLMKISGTSSTKEYLQWLLLVWSAIDQSCRFGSSARSWHQTWTDQSCSPQIQRPNFSWTKLLGNNPCLDVLD